MNGTAIRYGQPIKISVISRVKLKFLYNQLFDYAVQNEYVPLPEELILEEGIMTEWGDYLLEVTKRDIKESSRENGKIIFLGDKTNIKVRSRKEGDRIYLKNLGYKKIKKILIDEKIEKKERERIPVIELDNEIAAIGDIKISGKLELSRNAVSKEQMKLIIRRKNAK